MGDIGMHRLGILQDRIEKRLGVSQQTISDHLPKMPALANPVDSDLSRGFTVAQVAEKHGRTGPMAWSLALEKQERSRTIQRLWLEIKAFPMKRDRRSE